jgi:hypothetical protein
MTPETELWMLFLTVAAAVTPWAFSLHAKVAVIASTIQTLPKMLDEMKDTIKQHEFRLDSHEKEIEAIKASARPNR